MSFIGGDAISKRVYEIGAGRQVGFNPFHQSPPCHPVVHLIQHYGQNYTDPINDLAVVLVNAEDHYAAADHLMIRAPSSAPNADPYHRTTRSSHYSRGNYV